MDAPSIVVHAIETTKCTAVAAIKTATSNATRIAIVRGILLSLLVYAADMYGFTLVFPWFAATRDAVTAAAHAMFGVAEAVTYRVVARTSGLARQ